MALPPPPPIQADRSTNGNGQPPPAPIKPAATASPPPGQASQTSDSSQPIDPNDPYAQERKKYTRPWEQIPSVEPVDLGDTEAFQNSIQQQRGTFLGYNELHNEVWQEPDKPDGTKGSRYILQQGEQPYSDTRYYENQGPRQFTFKEGAYMPEINKVVAEYNGRDPWTNQAYVGSGGPGQPLTDDDKVALHGKIQAWINSKDPGQYYQQGLQQEQDRIKQFEALSDNMSKLNDKDIGLYTNYIKNWDNATRQDFIKNAPTAEDKVKRIAFVNVVNQLTYLQDKDIPVLGAPPQHEGGGGGGIEAPGLAVMAGSKWGAWGALLGLGAEQAIQKGSSAAQYLLGHGPLLYQLRDSLPQQLNQMKGDYIDNVSYLGQNRYRYTQNMRDSANGYIDDLKKAEINRDTPPGYSRPIPEAAESKQKGIIQGGWYSRYQSGGLVMPPPAPISKRQPLAQPVPSYASQAELNAAGHPAGTRFHWQPTNREYVTT